MIGDIGNSMYTKEKCIAKTEEFFILDTETGKFVGIDSNSGGYPYLTDSIVSAHRFTTLDHAVQYRSEQKCWKIVKINITTTEII